MKCIRVSNHKQSLLSDHWPWIDISRKKKRILLSKHTSSRIYVQCHHLNLIISDKILPDTLNDLMEFIVGLSSIKAHWELVTQTLGESSDVVGRDSHCSYFVVTCHFR